VTRLTFQHRNAKLGREVYTFSLPSGFSCPGADSCLSKAVYNGNGKCKVVDGPNTRVRCFSASNEAQYPSVRKCRWDNFEALRKCSSLGKVELILKSMPGADSGVLRIHVGGDFYSQAYFDAWCHVALQRPKWLFYAYTKSIPYWMKRLNKIPDNLILTASLGGKHDRLLIKQPLKYCKVVFSKEETHLPIDHDDSLARTPIVNFALLLHGTQPKGSDASRAKSKLRQAGWSGYAR
jgi:hypothetical protein